MSTEKQSGKPPQNLHLNRFAQLAKLGEFVFHARDLANLWHIQNLNTLYTTLRRYAKQKLLFRIYKGFYALKPVGELNPFLLGVKALHEYAYVSCETILVQEGILQQRIESITLVSSQTKRFSIGDYSYLSRKLADQFLYNPFGVGEEDGIRKATLERAAADLLYFNPRAYLDAGNSHSIDWRRVKQIQQQIGYSLTPERYRFYDSPLSKRRAS